MCNSKEKKILKVSRVKLKQKKTKITDLSAITLKHCGSLSLEDSGELKAPSFIIIFSVNGH